MNKSEFEKHHDRYGRSLEYWGACKETEDRHGFHLMDNKNSEIDQIWLSDKQARNLAFAILRSITRNLK